MNIVYDEAETNDFKGISCFKDLTERSFELFGKIVWADPNMKIMHEQDDQNQIRYFLVLHGERFIELDPLQSNMQIEIKIVPIRFDFVQPADCIYSLRDVENDLVRLKIDHFKCRDRLPEIVFKECKGSELIETLKEYKTKSVIVKKMDSDGIQVITETIEIESLAELFSFMWVEIHSDYSREPLESKLTSVGIRQVQLVKEHIQSLHNIVLGDGQYYAAFTSMIQSSGSGKTRVSIEILREKPGLYLNFRKENSEIPYEQPWMTRFSEYISDAQMDELPCSAYQLEYNSVAKPEQYTFGRFLIALSMILKKYHKSLVELIELNMKRTDEIDAIDRAIDKLGRYFLSPYSEFDVDFSSPPSFPYFQLLKQDICQTINLILIISQKRNSRDYFPFVLFIDGIDKFNAPIPYHRASRLDIVRRGMHVLDHKTGIMTVAIETNVNAKMYTPLPLFPNIRGVYHLIRKEILPPFILSGNWDVFSEEIDYHKIEMSRDLLLNQSFHHVLTTMGRPQWNFVQSERAILNAYNEFTDKHENETGTYVAAILARVPLKVNTDHVLATSLVKNHFMSLHYLSTDAKTIKVGYSSEPILAHGARIYLKGTRSKESCFKALKKMFDLEAIHRERVTEAMFQQLTLFAIDGIKTKESILEYTNEPEKMPETIRKVFEDKTLSKFGSLYDDRYKVATVGMFLKSMLGDVRFEHIRPMLSDSVLNGLTSCTQFVQLENTNLKVFQGLGDVKSRADGKIIDRSLLNCGLMRFCGFAMPPKYYGIDYIIPIILYDPEKKYERPVYSFIAFKTQDTRTKVSECAYKMTANLHLVRCPNHSNEAACTAAHCSVYFDDAEMKTICDNQVVILLAAKNNITNLQVRTTVSLKNMSYSKSQLFDIEGCEKFILEKTKSKYMDCINTAIEDADLLKPVSYPKLCNAPESFKPDFVLTKTVNDSFTLQKMIWNPEETVHRSLLCISCHDIESCCNIVEEKVILLIKEIISLEPSNFNNFDELHEPTLQNSMLNGSFCPNQDENPLLRRMRGQKKLEDPFKNYYGDRGNFGNGALDSSSYNCAIGPLEVKDNPPETTVKQRLNRIDSRNPELTRNQDPEEDE